MDFFAKQESARKSTFRLVLLLLVAVLGVILATDLVVAIISLFFADGSSSDVPPRIGLFQYPTMDEVILLAIIFFALRRLYQLRDGGESVAKMVKARQVLRNASSLEEKRLLNVVDEMAIAAGVAVPSVWVMDKEEGINAFAAGYSPNQAVIVVTSGALSKLNREELQGVIGHEFGHILNGDMRLNVRLIGILAGIVVVGEAGLLIIRLGFEADDIRGLLLAIVVGAIVASVGYIGVFCGRMIKAAVSRQREFLADASSVQFTRNPDGLVSALEKIRRGNGTLVKNAYAGEMSHMFFGQAFTTAFGDMLATHPSIEERLASLTGRIPQALPPSLGKTPADSASASPESDAAIAGFGGDVASTVLAQVGNATPQHVELASQQLAAMPDSLRQSLNTAQGARCAMFAYLISPNAAVLAIQIRALTKAGDGDMATSFTDVTMALQALGPKSRLTVLALALPALRQMDQAARDVFLLAVDELIMADQKVTLSEFVLRTILQWQLSAKATRAERVRFQTIASVKDDVVLLLATLARAGSDNPKAQVVAFDCGAARIKLLENLPDSTTLDAKALSAALNRLRHLSPLKKPSLIKACVDTALADGKLMVAEFELLRTIGMAIDCPIPPSLETENVV
jgi:Zn-dependent protease with chaperone function/uncharacterized tellurite resistance protein B-like protein